MVEQTQVIVEIKPDGEIVVRAEGFQGPACVDAVRRYAEALGVAVEERHTADYYLEVQEDQTVALGEGGEW